ncbi:MAG: helix-turn-helix transcriptional regulator [Deltaproteobacteria bacterium]|nr:helix-turn-helix transcriptional regulator [Deltaproteobacteria bacterium]
MDIELEAIIGAAAKQAKKALQLTQEDVAEQLELSTEFYARIERGKALPSVRTMRCMAEVLKVSSDALLGLEVLRTEVVLDEDSPELRRVIRRLRAAPQKTQKAIGVILKEK